MLPHAKTGCSPQPPSPLLPGGGCKGTWQGEGRERGPRTEITAKNLKKKIKIKSQGERLAICRVGARAGAARQPHAAAAAWVLPAPSDSAPGRERCSGIPRCLAPHSTPGHALGGRDSRGRNPPPWGQPQAGAASNPSRLGSNPSHLQRFLGKEEKTRWKRRLFFFSPHRSHVSMAPGGELLVHGPDASWGPGVRQGEAGMPLHHGHADLGLPLREGTRSEDAAQMSPKRPQNGHSGLATTPRAEVAPCGVKPSRVTPEASPPRCRPRVPSCRVPRGAGGLRRPRCCAGSATSPANTVPARETKARLLTAGEERLNALLSPASKWVYSLRIKLGGPGRRRRVGGRGTGCSFFPLSDDSPPPLSGPLLLPPPLHQGSLEMINPRRRRRLQWEVHVAVGHGPPLRSTVPWGGGRQCWGGGTASTRTQFSPLRAPRAARVRFPSKPEPARKDFGDADGLKGHGRTPLPTGTPLWGWVCSLLHSYPLSHVIPGWLPK